MRLLYLHNYYQWSGGEDRVFEAEVALLRRHGHQVFTYTRSNREIRSAWPLRAAWEATWNPKSYSQVGQLLRRERIELMHCGNLFPLISPSVYFAAARLSVPVVQTLHNFRLLCAGSSLFRGGRVCQKCISHQAFPWPAIGHACYRNSRAATSAVVSLQMVHRALGTWQKNVSTFIAPSQYLADTFQVAKFPLARVRVKPHFLESDPGQGGGEGGYAAFVGRWVPEKGIETLLEAFSEWSMPLKVAGEGPLEGMIRAAAQANPAIEVLGQLSAEQVTHLMQNAKVVIVPSEAPEVFGLTVIEAFACGTPVVAANFGSLPEWVEPGQNGCLFEPRRPQELRQAIQSIQPVLREGARSSYQERFSAESNYAQLVQIYQEALA